MIYMFAAVCFVLLIMNLFMLFVLRQMVKSTGRRIEKDAGRIFASYEELIEKESGRLQELMEETETLRTKREDVSVPSVSGLPGGGQHSPSVRTISAPFQEEDFQALYRKIKKEFQYPPEELIRNLKRETQEEVLQDRGRKQLLQSLMEMLDFEVLYQISTLTESRQREIMEEVLTGEEYGLYQEWKAAFPERDVIAFADWLALEYAKLDTVITVRIPEEREGITDPSDSREDSVMTDTEEKISGQDGVQFQTDPSICEGIRVYYRGRLYDYSI